MAAKQAKDKAAKDAPAPVKPTAVPNPATQRSQACINLFDAIGESNEDKVASILENCQEDVKELLTKKDHQGLTPLRKAVALSKGEMTRILVAYGADPAQPGARDKLALHEAARLGQRTLIAPLLTNSCINARDKDGRTALHYAVRGHHVKTVQWLLFGGAEVDVKDAQEHAPIDLVKHDSDDERDRAIFQTLYNQKFAKMDTQPPVLSCGYIEQKKLTKLGPDNGLMFVTSGLWSTIPQFIFVVQVLPDNAVPPIPLRRDEVFYSVLFRYKMMRKLANDEKRVKVFFAFQERLTHSELVLKLTSKTKYLGEMAPTITRYLHDNYYINYLASCEIDLQNEGQFVLVRRPVVEPLIRCLDGSLNTELEPLFKLAISEATFPEPPAKWHENRRKREWDEVQGDVKNLMVEKGIRFDDGQNGQDGDDGQDNSQGDNANQNQTNATVGGNAKQDMTNNADAGGEQDGEEAVGSDMNLGQQPGDLLEWDEEDECEDFFFISRGWGPSLEVLKSLMPSSVMPRYMKEVEDPLIRAYTFFFRIKHTSNGMADRCLCQVPKTPEFLRMGHVLVFKRKELEDGEPECPDPDDKKEEFYMSDDGKHLHGWVWLQKERRRWSLIEDRIVNRRTRLIFPAHELCTYVGVQLYDGEEVPDPETDDTESEDESEEDEDGEKAPTEAGEEEQGESSEKKKKKKKKKKDADESESESGLTQDADKSENNRSNKNTNAEESGEKETIYQVLEPITSSFALGVDDEFQASSVYRQEDGESAENLGRPEKEIVISPALRSEEEYKGQMKKPPEIQDELMEQLPLEVAIMYRYRNHRETKILVFSRPRADFCFDMLVEIVQVSEIDVRAEYRWKERYRLVELSPSFPTKTGRQFGFSLEGTMTVISPSDIHMRTIFFYSMTSNCLTYVVKRPSLAMEEPTKGGGRAGGRRNTKRREDMFKMETNEIDAHLEVTAYPRGTNMDGMDIASLEIKLTGPTLWRTRHLEMRKSDEVLTTSVVAVLIQDEAFTTDWWKVWLMLDYGEKAIDVEKVKNDWASTSKMMLEKWFSDNVDKTDRGIMHLLYVFDTLRLHEAVDKLVGQLRSYKTKLQMQEVQPRQIDLLFHWILRTKLTRSNLIRIVAEPQVMRPVSEQFLLRTSELLNIEELYQIGSLLDLEDNVINSIMGEEYITDPLYKCFKLLMRCKQKKEEIVAYTLMLLGMAQTMNFSEATHFVATETRRWMRTVTDTEPETCTKLENILPATPKA